MSTIQAVILAAGRGSRLGESSDDVPKPLLEIGRRRLIEHQLDLLAEAGVGPTHMVLGYGAEEIREIVGRRAEFVVNTRWESTNSLYSVWLAREKIQGDLLRLNCDVLFDSDWTRQTRVEAWVTLLDLDQLRAINDSEGLNADSGNYSLARFPGFRIDGWDRSVAPLGYSGNAEVFVSPLLGTPMAFSTVEASGRDIFAGGPLEMWDHLFDVYGLRAEIARLADVPDDVSLSRSLSAFMNRNWWRVFEGKEDPAPEFGPTVALLKDVFHGDARESSTSFYLAEKGLMLDRAVAYEPGEELTLRGIVGG